MPSLLISAGSRRGSSTSSEKTFRIAPDTLAKIGDSKSVEFQVTGDSYKLNQKNLTKLKDLAEYAPPSTK
jgi:hypothetical protein